MSVYTPISRPEEPLSCYIIGEAINAINLEATRSAAEAAEGADHCEIKRHGNRYGGPGRPRDIMTI